MGWRPFVSPIDVSELNQLAHICVRSPMARSKTQGRKTQSQAKPAPQPKDQLFTLLEEHKACITDQFELWKNAGKSKEDKETKNDALQDAVQTIADNFDIDDEKVLHEVYEVCTGLSSTRLDALNGCAACTPVVWE